MKSMEEIYKSLEKNLPTNEHKLNFCASILGFSARQSIFIIEKIDNLKPNAEIMYCITATMLNLQSLKKGISLEKVIPQWDLGLEGGTYKEKFIKLLKYANELYKEDLS